MFAPVTFVLPFPANLDPLMKISILGIDRETYIDPGVFTLWGNQWVLFAVLVGAFAVVLPFIRFGLLSVALACVRACVRSGWRPWWLGRVYRFSLKLDPSAMPGRKSSACSVRLEE
jgi:paraquat-inducible protein A